MTVHQLGNAGNSTAALRTPAAPGTYAFVCAIHPQMKGTLTVL